MTNPQWSRPLGETIRIGATASPRLLSNQRTTRLHGDGPVEATASLTIEQQPFCWDNNGFYRRLGLEPGAPRIEVARAYMDLNGHRSSRLTNAATVLIDKHTKRIYDRLPLGTFWGADEDRIQDRLNGTIVPAFEDDWSVYVIELTADEIESIDHDLVSEWRCMISWMLWSAEVGPRHFSMGIGPGHGAALIGFRYVAVVTLTSKPSWEYVLRVCQELKALVEQDEAFPPRVTFPR